MIRISYIVFYFSLWLYITIMKFSYNLLILTINILHNTIIKHRSPACNIISKVWGTAQMHPSKTSQISNLPLQIILIKIWSQSMNSSCTFIGLETAQLLTAGGLIVTCFFDYCVVVNPLFCFSVNSILKPNQTT